LRTVQGSQFPSGIRFAAVVLAAGQSRRMGRPKALLPLAGKPILAHVLDTLRAAGCIGPVIVVTGHQPQDLEPILRGRAVERVHNGNFERGGMLSSVQAGLAAVAGRAEAVFVVLGDQPLVRPRTLRTMASAYAARRPRGVIPTCDGRRGHPVLLCAGGIDQILALPEGATLKTYTAGHNERMLELPVIDPAVLHDIDTPADYAAALARVERERIDDDDDDQRSQACPSPHTVEA
jgi:molybdenum cofactor cytidylyltransferase